MPIAAPLGEVPVEEPSFPAAFAYAAAQWKIEPAAALQAYLDVFTAHYLKAKQQLPVDGTDATHLRLQALAR